MKIFKAAKSIISPFLEGIASNLDFAGSIGNSPGPPVKDNDALIGDWQKQHPAANVIVLGDFNARPNEQSIKRHQRGMPRAASLGGRAARRQ